MHPYKALKSTVYILTLSILVSLGMSLFLAVTLYDTLWLYVSFGLVLVLVGTWPLLRDVEQRKKTCGVFVAIAVLNLIFVMPDLVFKIVGSPFDVGANHIREFCYPAASDYLRGLVPDEKLFWKNQPNLPEVNSWGFVGREIPPRKDPNTYRIVFLGDSCMEQGEYPYMVEQILNERSAVPGRRVESVMLAVSGYSSHQGRVLAELYGEKITPDLVVVCYGWNDHWLAWNTTDSEKVIRPPKSAVERVLTEIVRQSRLFQICQWLFRPVSGELLEEVRVPKEEYEENLLAINGTFSDLDCDVIFMTAPTPAYEDGLGYDIHPFAENETEVTTLHEQYNEIVREVSRKEEALLLDLEAEFLDIQNVESLFLEDKIHYTPEGVSFIAERLSEFIAEHMLECDD